ncbi:MAG: hypothetical protein FJ255_11210 [Phycisphaerae bacterium]|nr:hypothetical protein [Phycisphaerae bacterium]
MNGPIRVIGAAIAAGVLVGCSGGGYHAEYERGGKKADDPLEAAAFRYQQRLDEHGRMPPNALMTAKAHRDAMPAVAHAGDGPSFLWIGPGNIGGRLRAILVSPADPNVMYAGAASGGVLKSTNAGALWAPLNDFVPSLAIGCMAFKPGDANTLYAGTGEGFFETVEGTSNTAAVRGAGVFRSDDAGATWQQLPATATADFYFVTRLAISPANPDEMVASTSTGLWRSTDAGATWSRRRTGHTYDVQMRPGTPGELVAGGHDEPPLYSADGGVTWQVATGAPAHHRYEVRYARSSPATVYATASTNSGFIHVYRSTDGGRTYAPRFTSNTIQTYAAYNNVVWVDPTNPDLIIVGGVYLYRSSNAGTNMTRVLDSIHADHHAIVEHPAFDGSTNRVVYFGHDGGISRVDNAQTGTTSVSLNNNMGVTQFYGGAVSPSGVVIGGTQDNGTLRTTGNPQGWTRPLGGDGGFAAADPTNPNIMYAETQRLDIRRSTNGGTSFANIRQGITEAGTLDVNFIPYFLLDPNNPNRMLAAGRSLWRSDNVATGSPPAWSIIKPRLESGGDPGPIGAHFAGNDPRNISTIAIAEGNPDLVYVAHNNGQVYRSANATLASPDWTRVDENPGPLPDRWPSRIAIDPGHHDRVYVALMGYAAGNVWRSPDAGRTWLNASGAGGTALPPIPVPALAVQKDAPGRIYAGTDIGLFISGDDGATWSRLDPGVGPTPVEEFVWKDPRTLLVVTHGRGMYLGAVFCAADLNLDGVVDLNDFLEFLNRFNAGSDLADYTGDGVIDFNDLLAFLNVYNQPC